MRETLKTPILKVRFLLFPILFHITTSNLLQALPIVWSKSKTILTEGDVVETFVFNYFSPCSSFYNPRISNDSAKTFIEWCEGELGTKVVIPLETLCRSSPTAATQSRFTPSFNSVGGVYSSILGVASVKIHTKGGSTSGLAAVVDAIQPGLEYARLEELGTSIHESLQSSTSSSAESAKEELSDRLIQSLRSTLTLSAKLASYFEQSKSNINTLKEKWSSGSFSLKLFEIFMVELGVKEMSLYEHAVPIQCHLSPRDGIFYFQLRKSAKDFHVKVLDADAFTLYDLEPGKDWGYKLEYSGPRTVAYDTSTDCVVPYVASSSSVFFLPSSEDCRILNEKSVLKFWQKRCEPLYYLDESGIQIKIVGSNYSIYCHGHNITVFKTEYSCPNHVVSIHVNESFHISGRGLQGKPLYSEDFNAASVLISNKVSFHMMPGLMNLTMELGKFPVVSPCPSPPFPFGIVLGSMGGLLLVVFIVLMAVILYLIKKSKDEKNQGKAVNILRTVALRISPNSLPRPRPNRNQERPKNCRNSLSVIKDGKVSEQIQLFENGVAVTTVDDATSDIS